MKAKKQMGQVGDVKCFVEVISAPDSFRKGFQAVRYRVPGQAKVLTVKVMIGKKPEQEKKNDTAENQVSAKRRPLEEQKQKLKKNGKHKKLEEFDRNAAGRFMTRDVEEWCIQGSDGNKPAFTCPLQNKWGFDNSLEHCLSVFHRVPFETPGATGWVVFMDGAVGKGKNHGQFVPDAETRKEAEENYTSASQVLQLLDAATKNSGPDISGKAGDLLRELKKNATSWHVNAALHPTFNPEDCGEQRLNIKAIIDGHERHYHVDCQTAPHGPQNAEYIIKDIDELKHAYFKERQERVSAEAATTAPAPAAVPAQLRLPVLNLARFGPGGNFRTMVCEHHQNGFCRDGSKCRFRHG